MLAGGLFALALALSAMPAQPAADSVDGTSHA